MGISNITAETISWRQLTKGNFGLEKESLRVDANGYLAQTPHPFKGDPRRDRDFCENQVEMITGVCGSVEAVWEELALLHRETLRDLRAMESGPEYLWPCSNPAYVRNNEEIPIAHYTGELAQKEIYRNYLAEKYGKRKMLFSGIHYNFSFDEELLEEDFKNSRQVSFQEYKNSLYLDLAGKALRYSWLIVYLLSASSVLDGSYVDSAKIDTVIRSRYASPRCSEVGYWNQFLPTIDFTSLDGYVDSIQKYVDEGQLMQASELYYPVRLKPLGDNSMENLKASGVNHLELRMIDLNPLSEIGIDQRDLKFIHFLLLYLALQPSEICQVSDQIVSIRNMKSAALLNESEIRIERGWLRNLSVRDAAEEVLDEMEEILAAIPDVDTETLHACLQFQRNKVENASLRYAKILQTEYGTNYVQRMLKRIRDERSCPFWGSDRAVQTPITAEYPGIHTPRDLYVALQHIWCAETCASRMRKNWSPENCTLGQCSITGFLVQDIFGGEVRGVRRPAGNYHCFNDIGGSLFDLTSEQFGDKKLDYRNCPVQSREDHFSKEEKYLRYLKLKQDLKTYCMAHAGDTL